MAAPKGGSTVASWGTSLAVKTAVYWDNWKADQLDTNSADWKAVKSAGRWADTTAKWWAEWRAASSAEHSV